MTLVILTLILLGPPILLNGCMVATDVARVRMMHNDQIENHLRSSYRALAKCLIEFREHGINDDVAQDLMDLEFQTWAMLDRIQRNRRV